MREIGPKNGSNRRVGDFISTACIAEKQIRVYNIIKRHDAYFEDKLNDETLAFLSFKDYLYFEGKPHFTKRL